MNRKKIKEIRAALLDFTMEDLSIALDVDQRICAEFIANIVLGPRRKRGAAAKYVRMMEFKKEILGID